MQAGAQRDQPAVEFPEQLFVDARLIVESFHVTEGNQLAEIAIALVVHCQKNQMIVVFLGSLVDALLFEAAGRRDVDLAADDRFDAVAHRFAIKLDGAEHVAMIGHGNRRLFERLDALEQLVDFIGAVQEAVFGMAV